MTLRFSIQSTLGLLLLAHALTVHAQPADSADDSATVEAAAPTMLELLEFIGEFTTEDGEWVDPTLLLEAGESGAQDGTPELGARSTDEEQAAPVENCISPRCE